VLQADKMEALENKIDTLEKLRSGHNHAGPRQGRNQPHIIGTLEIDNSLRLWNENGQDAYQDNVFLEGLA
jgi:hypothetical protein